MKKQLQKNKARIIYCYKKKNDFFFGKNTPNEFLYGAKYLKKSNINTAKIFADNYKLLPKHLFYQQKEKIISKNTKIGIYFQSCLNNINKINKNDILFCINDGTSFGLLYFKHKGRINNKVIALIQGLHDRYQYFKSHKRFVNFYKKLLSQADLILTLSKYEKKLLAKNFSIPLKKIKVFYFGADKKFWNKNKVKNKKSSQDFALTIGNDMHRDYQLLIDHYNLKIPLKFITTILSEKQKTTVKEKSVFKHCYNIPSLKLREFYYQTKFVVIPLIKETQATAGLSACLQAMAMEKPVLLAKTPPMQELFQENKHLLFYQPENSQSFRKKLKLINNNKKLRTTLAKNSRKLIEEKFNSNINAKKASKIIKKLL
jgi:glycosyltransferase involved in cell wall biosynthesis